MKLSDKQMLFSRKIAVLIQVANEMGYGVTLGDCYRDDRCLYGHHNSLHKKRLAVDLNLFKDGQYLTDGSGHDVLHTVWSMIGGSAAIKNDLNHYSIEHEGRR